MNGWWIYVGTAAVSILSKYVIKLDGRHIFNPSNFGLVLCFLVLGESRAEPLDFWWGPMDAWMVVALAIIVGGGFAILTRLKLLHVAVAFWLTFAAGLGAARRSPATRCPRAGTSARSPTPTSGGCSSPRRRSSSSCSS